MEKTTEIRFLVQENEVSIIFPAACRVFNIKLVTHLKFHSLCKSAPFQKCNGIPKLR